MSNLSNIFAYKDQSEAEHAAGIWADRGYNVAMAGPTDKVRLSNGEDRPDFWHSGEQADWFVVIATKAPIKTLSSASF